VDSSVRQEREAQFARNIEQGMFATIDVEPADLKLFNYVVNSRLKEPTPSQRQK
jgi:hypothetical protein